MYALKVEVSREASTSAQAEPSGPTLTPSSESAQTTETIQVSAGNPRVEHITGLIHLYRQLGQRNSAAGAHLAQDVSVYLGIQEPPLHTATPVILAHSRSM